MVYKPTINIFQADKTFYLLADIPLKNFTLIIDQDTYQYNLSAKNYKRIDLTRPYFYNMGEYNFEAYIKDTYKNFNYTKESILLYLFVYSYIEQSTTKQYILEKCPADYFIIIPRNNNLETFVLSCTFVPEGTTEEYIKNDELEGRKTIHTEIPFKFTKQEKELYHLLMDDFSKTQDKYIYFR